MYMIAYNKKWFLKNHLAKHSSPYNEQAVFWEVFDC